MKISSKTSCGVCNSTMERGTYTREGSTYVFYVCDWCDRASGAVLAIRGITGKDSKPQGLGLWVTETKERIKKYYKKIGV